MAGKKKTTKAKKSEASNVTRVRATDSTPTSKKKKAEKPAKTKTVTATVVAETPSTDTTTPKKQKRKIKPGAALKPFKATGGYFKGAWVELKQVRWPNRRATWSMTGAVLLYTAFFVVLVLLLDAGFKYLFELILGK